MKDSDTLTAIFREQGLRVTPQRQVIFRLLEGDDSHPTVESLFDRVRADIATISLKTVYQTVHDLEALGEVRVLDLGTGSVRVDPNVEDDHHHLLCTTCGRVRDLPLEFAGLQVPIRYRRDFTVDDVQVIFRGRCHQCSDRI
jgi:Fur family transcriptional regulator, peroxide stress response regulator